MLVTTEPCLTVEQIGKTFGPVQVLSDITLEILPGEVVALIGENGSGKSTLIKILSGYHESDKGGVVTMGGHDVSGELHLGPEHTGMGFIHQDLALVESMTVLENLRIGHFDTGFLGRIRWRDEVDATAALLRRVGLDVDPMTRVGELSVTDRALVAIARGLGEIERAKRLDARILVLDEPTAYLPVSGVERLFAAIANLAREGVSILFVSHRLDEVLAHCSRVVVLRGGKLVADEPTAGRTERELVTLMLGRAPEDLYPAYALNPGPTALAITSLRGASIESLDLTVRDGEVVGLIGLPGSGYEAVPYLVAGAIAGSAESMTVHDREVDLSQLDPRRALEIGIALLPADRKSESGAQDLSVADNITIPTLHQCVRRGVIDHRQEQAVVARQVDRFRIALPNPHSALSSLSGGNQQKALLAKWAIAEPRILLLHEPTQGVDVGAKREVFRHLTDLAQAGAALVIASVEYGDLAALCTRVLVFRRGRVIREFAREELDAHELAVAVHG